MFVHFPPTFFASENTVSLFLDVLHAYGHVVAWTPMPAFRQAMAVFEQASEAQRIKQVLDRLLIPHDDDNDEGSSEAYVPFRIWSMTISLTRFSSMLRVYYDYDTPLVLLPSGDFVVARTLDGSTTTFLEPPVPERDFLISPPGSPPVGWEQQVEGRPNTDTLAQDLIEALQKLSTTAETKPVLEHQRRSCHEDGEESDHSEKRRISMLLSPQDAVNDVPGVILHALDEPTACQATGEPSLIHRVKATNDSMLGSTVSSTSFKRPTSRPPMCTYQVPKTARE